MDQPWMMKWEDALHKILSSGRKSLFSEQYSIYSFQLLTNSFFNCHIMSVIDNCMFPNLVTLLAILITLAKCAGWEVILSVEAFEDISSQYHRKYSVDEIPSARFSSWSWCKRKRSPKCLRVENSTIVIYVFFYLIVLVWLSLEDHHEWG